MCFVPGFSPYHVFLCLLVFSRQAAQGSATAIAAAKTDYEAKNADAVAAHNAKQAEKAASASSSAKDTEGSSESNNEASEYEQILEAAAGSAQQAGDLDALHEYFGQVLYCTTFRIRYFPIRLFMH